MKQQKDPTYTVPVVKRRDRMTTSALEGTRPRAVEPPRGGAFVSIVGAGPGDPELITVAGRERLRRADVVFYDDLVDRRLLLEAPEYAEMIFAGRRGWHGGTAARPTPDAIAQKAREADGKHVVRLKGGDPGVFGRLSEEIEALERADIPYEIVPGVTAAFSAAAAARIPLTKRGVASSVTLISATIAGGEAGTAAVQIGELIRTGDTVVLYMGHRALPTLIRSLVESGITPNLPATAISGASTSREHVVATTLEDLPGAVESAGLCPPVLVVLGRVAEYAVATDAPVMEGREVEIGAAG